MQDLHLALGQLRRLRAGRVGMRGGGDTLHRRLRERGRDRGAQLFVRDVLVQEAARAARDRQRHGLAVTGTRQHHDAGLGVLADEAAGGLQAAEAGHRDVHEYQVGPFRRPACENLLAAFGCVDTVDARQ